MTANATRILSAALGLPPIERAELIDELLRSFDPPQNNALEDVWKAEAESRIDAYEAGLLSADSMKTVFARIDRQ